MQKPTENPFQPPQHVSEVRSASLGGRLLIAALMTFGAVLAMLSLCGLLAGFAVIFAGKWAVGAGNIVISALLLWGALWMLKISWRDARAAALKVVPRDD